MLTQNRPSGALSRAGQQQSGGFIPDWERTALLATLPQKCLIFKVGSGTNSVLFPLGL
jgi:hypothetical protein